MCFLALLEAGFNLHSTRCSDYLWRVLYSCPPYAVARYRRTQNVVAKEKCTLKYYSIPSPRLFSKEDSAVCSSASGALLLLVLAHNGFKCWHAGDFKRFFRVPRCS